MKTCPRANKATISRNSLQVQVITIETSKPICRVVVCISVDIWSKEVHPDHPLCCDRWDTALCLTVVWPFHTGKCGYSWAYLLAFHHSIGNNQCLIRSLPAHLKCVFLLVYLNVDPVSLFQGVTSVVGSGQASFSCLWQVLTLFINTWQYFRRALSISCKLSCMGAKGAV